ncbi:MAG: His-Xaa-Ser system radical SAM maturase HxsC [Gammaproteobacteria bacterium]|nr:His-Xaa-Ser system radical SAM maturase HxsC [Gammaproteobacteria bacterium]
MKKYKGTSNNFGDVVLGIVTRQPWTIKRKGHILVSEDVPLFPVGFRGIVHTNVSDNKKLPAIKVQPNDLRMLSEGDCISLNQNGTVAVLWENRSPMNAFLLTESCDCRCLMCPQPPKVHNKSLVETSREILHLVNPTATQIICITGGESTLLNDDFFDFLTLIQEKCPKSPIMLLTNGKSFSDFSFTKKFIAVKPKNLLVCVSLHSDIDEVHDKIVGVNGSFYKTAMGLQNLARFRQLVEIRVVISKLNADRLESIANFIIRNFPFINHCAFMGMEITGYARKNYTDIWIDPSDYEEQLFKAVRTISRSKLKVSIYNIPLCLIRPTAWNFARKSISGWKNEYLPICSSCSVKKECCGIFTTSGAFQSVRIKPIISTTSLGIN